MSLIFSDTSAIIKRHIPEIGTAWVLSWVLPTNDNIIVIAEITTIEVFSTLARRRREGSLSPVNVATSQANFLLHAEKDYLVIPQDDAV